MIKKPITLAQRKGLTTTATGSSSNISMPVVGTPINTYQDLIEAIQLWADRDDEEFIKQIPNFIDFAQKEIFRTARWQFMHKEAYLYVNNGLADLPSDFLSPDYMYFADSGLMINPTSRDTISYELNSNWNKYSSEDRANNNLLEQAREVKYARFGKRLFFSPPFHADVPTQDDNGTGDIPTTAVVFGYYSDPVAFYNNPDDSAVNYLLQIAPDLLLNLSLKQAAYFMQNTDFIDYFESEAQKIFDQMTEQQKELDDNSGLVIHTPSINQFW
ncbi:TPA: hypothetical protein OUD88_002864 [Enterobacter hormaechei]|nr:hypothetical protein [Enterobacter hormaechei]